MRYSDYIDLSNCQAQNEPAWECPGTGCGEERSGFCPLGPGVGPVLDKASVSQFLSPKTDLPQRRFMKIMFILVKPSEKCKWNLPTPSVSVSGSSVYKR